MSIFSTVTETEVTQEGSLSQGFLSASIKNVGTQVALVNGVSLGVGEAKGYPFVGKGYEPISYDPQGSTLQIMEIN